MFKTDRYHTSAVKKKKSPLNEIYLERLGYILLTSLAVPNIVII
jgi:hypothetical protein